MEIRKILEKLKEKRRVSVEKGLEKTIDEIIKVESEENSDRYFLMKLNKQYYRLQRSANGLEIDTSQYQKKLNEFYQNEKRNI
ncbi:MAG: hypothetical protein WDZ77_00595 [Candidatus Pacearchaeota archaeon]